MKKIFLFLSIASSTALSQIIITSNDVAGIFAAGNNTTIHQDTLQSMINIGSPGGGNNWDFTALLSNLTISLESVDPAATPYISDFPGADICIYNAGFTGGDPASIWTYSKLNGSFDVMGSAATVSSLPGFVTQISYNPFRRESEHPMTINSQWMQTITQTILINGSPLNSSTVSTNALVDAYGTMTLPGGASFEALRIREELTVNGLTSVSYSFVSKSGAQVSLEALSANPPTSGVINVEATNYYGALTPTAVDQTYVLPVNYALEQNYPNPFNPSTNIVYSLPEASFVQLIVYDVLGKEIATLVNEEQSAGVYYANFAGSELASGFYLATLMAGSYVQTIKMILMR